MRRLCFLIVAVLRTVLTEQFSYEGYKVYSLNVSNQHELRALDQLSDNEKIDFWSSLDLDEDSIDVMVDPDEQEMFERFLKANNLKHDIIINNVESTIQQETLSQLETPFLPDGKISFDKYNKLRKIYAYLNRLAKDYPDIVKVDSIGKSYKGRDVKVIKISSKSNRPKPIIFIDACIHAREWITPAQALYFIQELVENSANRKLIERVEWQIVPVLNPDGYVHSHRLNRLWRKTRSGSLPCKGVDGNRNFDFHWGEGGSSSIKCSFRYKGRSAFSEPELRALRDHILKHKANIKLYLSLHSYGNIFIPPWGYTKRRPDNYQELQQLAKSAARAIEKAHRTSYRVSTSDGSVVSGFSIDWAKGKAGIDLAYLIELPKGGISGFNPPPWRIKFIVPEMWTGVKVFHQHIENKFGLATA